MTVPPQLCLTFQGNVKSNCTVNERTFPSQTSQDVSLHNNKRWVLHNSTSALCFHRPTNSIYRAWPLRFRWTVCFNTIMEAHRGSSDHRDILCITVGRGMWHYINKAELDRCTSMPSSIKFTAFALMNGSRKTSSKNTFQEWILR